MIAELLIIVPLGGGGTGGPLAEQSYRPCECYRVIGLVHVGLSFWLLFIPPGRRRRTHGWPLILWRAALLAGGVVVVFVCAVYGVTYLQLRKERPNRSFVALRACGVGVCLVPANQARHSVLYYWIANRGWSRWRRLPLLHFNGTPRAFEATWNNLLVAHGQSRACAAGVSLAWVNASLQRRAGHLTFVALMAARRRRVPPDG